MSYHPTSYSTNHQPSGWAVIVNQDGASDAPTSSDQPQKFMPLPPYTAPPLTSGTGASSALAPPLPPRPVGGPSDLTPHLFLDFPPPPRSPNRPPALPPRTQVQTGPRDAYSQRHCAQRSHLTAQPVYTQLQHMQQYIPQPAYSPTGHSQQTAFSQLFNQKPGQVSQPTNLQQPVYFPQLSSSNVHQSVPSQSAYTQTTYVPRQAYSQAHPSQQIAHPETAYSEQISLTAVSYTPNLLGRPAFTVSSGLPLPPPPPSQSAVPGAGSTFTGQSGPPAGGGQQQPLATAAAYETQPSESGHSASDSRGPAIHVLSDLGPVSADQTNADSLCHTALPQLQDPASSPPEQAAARGQPSGGVQVVGLPPEQDKQPAQQHVSMASVELKYSTVPVELPTDFSYVYSGPLPCEPSETLTHDKAAGVGQSRAQSSVLKLTENTDSWLMSATVSGPLIIPDFSTASAGEQKQAGLAENQQVIVTLNHSGEFQP